LHESDISDEIKKTFDAKIITLLKYTGPCGTGLSTNFLCSLPNVTYCTAKSLSKMPDHNIVNLACNVFFTKFTLHYAIAPITCFGL